MAPLLRSRLTRALAATAAVAVVLLVGNALMGGSALGDVPTYTVTSGPFRVSHFEAGEVWAINNERIAAPRVDGRLTITHLWPEGERVEVGDLILQFDRSEFEVTVRERTEQLEQANVNMASALADQRQKVADLKMQIEHTEAALELAKISLQKAEYGSPVERERRTITLKQAERRYSEARESLEARYLINQAQTANLELRIQQAQKRYDKALKDFGRLTVYAERPGILVHEMIEKGPEDRKQKIKEGDSVWGGINVMTFPDLSAMKVMSQVGEMDIHMIRVGLEALIELEAFPGPVFHGVVSSVAPMAIKDDDAQNVQIFDIVITIKEQDRRLYPGMSAAVEIIVDNLEDVLSVPLPALHLDGEGRPFVYRLTGRAFETREIAVDRRNATAVVVESGLETGDVIALGSPGIL